MNDLDYLRLSGLPELPERATQVELKSLQQAAQVANERLSYLADLEREQGWTLFMLHLTGLRRDAFAKVCAPKTAHDLAMDAGALAMSEDLLTWLTRERDAAQTAVSEFEQAQHASR